MITKPTIPWRLHGLDEVTAYVSDFLSCDEGAGLGLLWNVSSGDSHIHNRYALQLDEVVYDLKHHRHAEADLIRTIDTCTSVQVLILGD